MPIDKQNKIATGLLLQTILHRLTNTTNLTQHPASRDCFCQLYGGFYHRIIDIQRLLSIGLIVFALA